MDRGRRPSSMKPGLLASIVSFHRQHRQKQDRDSIAQAKGDPKAARGRRRRSSLPPTPAESFSNDDEVVPAAEERQPATPPHQPPPTLPRGRVRSLGVGSMQGDGIVVRFFEPIPEEGKARGADPAAASSAAVLIDGGAAHTHYLRISDLRRLDSSLHSSLHGSSLHGTTTTTSSASSAPTGDDRDLDRDDDSPDAVDQWLWLGCATNSPVAVNALAEVGWSVAMSRKLWTLASPAPAPSQHQRHAAWQEATFHPSHAEAAAAPLLLGPPCGELPILVWTGKLHGLHRSDLPAVRAAAAVPASPRELVELLVDSGRVRQYNPHSQGREDLHVLQPSLQGGRYGGVTKIMRSSSKPPLVRKALEFTSLLHARAVWGGRGYLVVTRSVSNRHNDGAAAAASLASSSEILLSVNLLLPMSDRDSHPDQRTMVITVNHIYSPLIPMMLAKRIGVQAAANFLLELKQSVRTNAPSCEIVAST